MGGLVAAPVSTYRLQLTPHFGFAEAGALARYLADLGVTHVYLSPVLQAAPGSMHGYDVVDHAKISEELGGEPAFREMAARLRAHGIGIVVDIVPNHMAISAPESLNRQLWDVLKNGRASKYDRWFDIDWDAAGGRMLLPILGAPLHECIGDITLDETGEETGEPVVRYYDHVLPVRPGTEKLPLPGLLDAQHYQLGWWRTTITKLNWRRFFDVATLIGVRVEDPVVFSETHATVLRLVAEGLVDGLRIDHPDGLADPRGYLRRLAKETNGMWVVAEKILSVGERLPDDWPCAGTTGYDALRAVDGLFVDAGAGDALTAEYARFAAVSGPGGVPQDYASVALGGKREAAASLLIAEVARLARLLRDCRPEAALEDARAVLAEVLAAFEVYRAYVYPPESPSVAAVTAVRDAVAAAATRLPERLRCLASAAGDLALFFTGQEQAGQEQGGQEQAGQEQDDHGRGEAAEFAVRFGQTTGPVLAKGVEDTASYRWPRLVALNEVGNDPGRFGVPVGEFHAFAAHLARDWPTTMTTLSSHDTKRQEDVRARLAVLAEMPAEWGRRAIEWHGLAGSSGDYEAQVGPDTEYLLWQTLVGTWPITEDRLSTYLVKVVREAKTHTSWIDPDEAYEKAVLDLGRTALGNPALSVSIEDFVTTIAADAAVNSLGAKLVQLTMPGVPDVYQGCELTGLSLVDPDNRRPVDFDRRAALLSALDSGEGTQMGGLDADKLLVTARTLRLRRDHPDWFLGGYEPLHAEGSRADHVVAFARGRSVSVATRLPRGLRRHGGWADTALPLPPGIPAWRDVLTGTVVDRGRVLLSDLTDRFPVALLVPEAE
jgi:(1->4)-alpha-D-glucan 1-alpha-D-glucosylmutase